MYNNIKGVLKVDNMKIAIDILKEMIDKNLVLPGTEEQIFHIIKLKLNDMNKDV